MTDIQAQAVEQRVLASLMTVGSPMAIDQLIDRIRHADEQVRSVDVKIAALDLVSKGCANLNDAWQLVAIR